MPAIWNLMREVYEESREEQPLSPWATFHQKMAEIGLARARKALIRGSRQPNNFTYLIRVRMRAASRQGRT